MVDRYSFSEQNVSFFYNDEPSCREKNNLDPDSKWLVMYTNEDRDPDAYPYDEEMAFDDLIDTLITKIVVASNVWGQRAHAAMFDLDHNALIYMMPEDFESPEELASDWKFQLMSQIIASQQKEDEPSYLPIVSIFDRDTETVDSLNSILEISKEELPAFYLYNAASDQHVKYSFPLDDIRNHSPDLLLTWAMTQTTQFELESYQKELEDLEAQDIASPENRERIREKLTNAIKGATEELEMLQEVTELIRGDL